MHHALSRVAIVLCALSAFLYTFTAYLFGLSYPAIATFQSFRSSSMSTNFSVNIAWHAPSDTWATSLNDVINGTGVNGFIFNSSNNPPGSPYGTYNWCNMPHVRPQEYKKVDSEYLLEYVELVCFPSCDAFKIARQTLNCPDSQAP